MKEEKRPSEEGQILAGVVMLLVLLLIIVPVMVKWVQQDSRHSVKDQKATVAFNLAEAAIDRGIWKLKSSTGAWADGLAGRAISNYNFDATFSEVSGGYYRIKFSSGPTAKQVTIYGEGKDSAGKEIRSIRCVVEDATVHGALFSQGTVTFSDNFQIHWGPIVAQNNINIPAGGAAMKSPRKLSKQVVQTTGGATPVRDVNGINPPNTDNLEWWSAYDIPEMPMLDFTTMRSSASANKTLNRCSSRSGSVCIFNNSSSTTSAASNLIWYWDASITSSPCTPASPCTSVDMQGTIGLKGTLIFRGNLTLTGSDAFAAYTAAMPTEAWKEYQKCDTATQYEYPGDAGYHTSAATYIIGGTYAGANAWNSGACFAAADIPASGNTDVSFKGFVYVGGNLALNSTPDINGAVWVVGNVTRTGSGFTLIFYDENLINIPTINVVLIRKSWQEQSPMTTAWAAP